MNGDPQMRMRRNARRFRKRDWLVYERAHPVRGLCLAKNPRSRYAFCPSGHSVKILSRASETHLDSFHEMGIRVSCNLYSKSVKKIFSYVFFFFEVRLNRIDHFVRNKVQRSKL